jgi:hypothetical protein
MSTSSLIFKPDIKLYPVSRLDSLSNSEDGKQIQNRSSSDLPLAIYDKGEKLISHTEQDSYTQSTIHIYTEVEVSIKNGDEVTFEGRIYTIVESKHRAEHSFYRAVSHV